MTLRILSVQHAHHGLAEVARASESAHILAEELRSVRGVDGVVVLATCNRVELLLDAPGITTAHALLKLARIGQAPSTWNAFEGDAALTHLFRVAAGLESMVVGEREIAGQLRRALLNLLRNAIQAAAGTGEVVVIQTKQDGECVTICVKNQGEPILADVMEHLFEPF